MLKFEPNMTQDMVGVLKRFRMIYDAEIQLCQKELNKATTAANISLPAIAADNVTPVLHGARLAMDQLVTYWETRLKLAKHLEFYT